jgi:hypothetical protein
MNPLFKKTAGLLAGLLATGLSYAQAPANLWSKSYGGSALDALNSIIPLADGGMIGVGVTASSNGDVAGKAAGSTDNDCWVVQFNDTGKIVRQRVFGSTGSENLYTIRPLRKGGYIASGFLTGNTRDFTGVTFHGLLDGAIIKLNDTLGVEWVRAYGGSGNEAFNDIQEMPDGKLVVSGYTASADGDITDKKNGTTDDWWVVVTDSAGNVLHNKTYGGGGTSPLYQERSFSVQCDPRGGYVAAGNGASSDGVLTGLGRGLSDLWVLKLDDTLGIVWNKTYGGSAADYGSNIIVSPDSNFVLAGNTRSVDGTIANPKGGGQADVWIAKLNYANGDTLWTRSYGGTKADATIGWNAINNAIDGGFLIAANTLSMDLDVSNHYGGSTNTYTDCWAVKLDHAGTIVWERNLGTIGIDNPNEMIPFPDGSVVFCGQSQGTGGEAVTNKGGQDVFLTRIAPCPAYTYISATTCEGHPYVFNGIAQFAAGIYYDTLSMAAGCDSIIQLTLLVNPSFTTALNDTICKGAVYVFNGKTLSVAGVYTDTFALAATGCDSFVQLTLVVNSITKPVIAAAVNVLSTGVYAGYQWLDGTNAPIPGANSSSYTALSSGNYRVVVSGDNGCTDTSDVYVHTSTGISETMLAGVSLYPNPVNQLLHIKLPASFGKAQAILYAADGSVVRSLELQEGVTPLSMQALAPGLYFIRITNEQGSLVQRIQKQ